MFSVIITATSKKNVYPIVISGKMRVDPLITQQKMKIIFSTNEYKSLEGIPCRHPE